MRTVLASGLSCLVGVLALADSRPAEACGGCFVPQSDATVVTDHRMAFSMSPQQSILWDQIRYSGDPKEFAWVLPVRSGARIEVANDEFFAALDSTSQPRVFAPQSTTGAVGCGLAGCGGEDSDSAFAAGPGGTVEVLSQSVVGPYEQVTLRATDEDALTTWLRRNEFTIPVSIEPTVSAYVREGFDFIALKLRPACGERAMRPVRVVTPGADPSLPLRMVAAGVGPRVGITLYVIGQGRYRPQNFPWTFIDDDRLTWDRLANKSNYEELSQEVMAQAEGRTWIIEYADKAQISPSPGFKTPSASVFFGTPGLTDAYYRQCKALRGAFGGASSSSSSSSSGGTTFTPCPQDQTPIQQPEPVPDGGGDASPDASNEGGAGDGETPGDAGGRVDAARPFPSGDPSTDCTYLDDIDVAVDGLHRQDVWVTRMRSVLPVAALAGDDLRVEPALLPDGRADPTAVSNLHWTPYYSDQVRPTTTDKTSCEGAPKQHRSYGAWVFWMVASLVAVARARRRRR